MAVSGHPVLFPVVGQASAERLKSVVIERAFHINYGGKPSFGGGKGWVERLESESRVLLRARLQRGRGVGRLGSIPGTARRLAEQGM